MILAIAPDPRWTPWFKSQGQWIAKALSTQITVWDIGEVEKNFPEGTFGEDLSDEAADWCVAYQEWRIENGYGFQPSKTVEEWRQWVHMMHNKLVTGIKVTKPSCVFTTGRSRAAQRVIYAAAQTMGLDCWSCERAIFPHRDRVQQLFTYGKASYEEVPEDIADQWQAHKTDEDRIREYIEWWKASKQTKHFHDPNTEGNARAREMAKGKLVWIMQVPSDAACYIPWVTPGDIQRLTSELLSTSSSVVAKFHPAYPHGESVGIPKLPPCNVHSVLESCNSVSVLSSAVGIEAWLYDRRVYVYGNPFYRMDGVLTDYSFDPEKRLQFLDWYIHERQTSLSDTEAVRRRLGV